MLNESIFTTKNSEHFFWLHVPKVHRRVESFSKTHRFFFQYRRLYLHWSDTVSPNVNDKSAFNLHHA